MFIRQSDVPIFIFFHYKLNISGCFLPDFPWVLVVLLNPAKRKKYISCMCSEKSCWKIVLLHVTKCTCLTSHAMSIHTIALFYATEREIHVCLVREIYPGVNFCSILITCSTVQTELMLVLPGVYKELKVAVYQQRAVTLPSLRIFQKEHVEIFMLHVDACFDAIWWFFFNARELFSLICIVWIGLIWIKWIWLH